MSQKRTNSFKFIVYTSYLLVCIPFRFNFVSLINTTLKHTIQKYDFILFKEDIFVFTTISYHVIVNGTQLRWVSVEITQENYQGIMLKLVDENKYSVLKTRMLVD